MGGERKRVSECSSVFLRLLQNQYFAMIHSSLLAAFWLNTSRPAHLNLNIRYPVPQSDFKGNYAHLFEIVVFDLFMNLFI